MKLERLRRSPWALPLPLAAGSLFAQIASLAADGIWDVLSWLLLFLPLAVVASAVMYRKRSSRTDRAVDRRQGSPGSDSPIVK
jgi:hypothetical protein